MSNARARQLMWLARLHMKPRHRARCGLGVCLPGGECISRVRFPEGKSKMRLREFVWVKFTPRTSPAAPASDQST